MKILDLKIHEMKVGDIFTAIDNRNGFIINLYKIVGIENEDYFLERRVSNEGKFVPFEKMNISVFDQLNTFFILRE